MKSQEEKSEAHKALQPKNMEKNSVRLIMAYDLAGYGTRETSELMNMDEGRISVIKNSPVYKEEKKKRFDEILASVGTGVAKQVIEDPARKILNDARVEAAEVKVGLLRSKQDFVKNSASSEILAFGGILPAKHGEERSRVTVVLEKKLAKNFGFALGYEEPVSQVQVTKEKVEFK